MSRLFELDWTPTKDDHYTPRWIFDAMGLVFDIDVAAPPGGVEWIPARRHYTMHDDGLAQSWDGLIWCNPPFSNVAPWAHRWMSHPDGVFMSCASRAAWLSALVGASEVVWLTHRNVEFARPDGAPEKHIPFLLFVAARGDGVTGVRRLATSGVPGALLVPDTAPLVSSEVPT